MFTTKFFFLGALLAYSWVNIVNGFKIDGKLGLPTSRTSTESTTAKPKNYQSSASAASVKTSRETISEPLIIQHKECTNGSCITKSKIISEFGTFCDEQGNCHRTNPFEPNYNISDTDSEEEFKPLPVVPILPGKKGITVPDSQNTRPYQVTTLGTPILRKLIPNYDFSVVPIYPGLKGVTRKIQNPTTYRPICGSDRSFNRRTNSSPANKPRHDIPTFPGYSEPHYHTDQPRYPHPYAIYSIRNEVPRNEIGSVRNNVGWLYPSPRIQERKWVPTNYSPYMNSGNSREIGRGVYNPSYRSYSPVRPPTSRTLNRGCHPLQNHARKVIPVDTSARSIVKPHFGIDGKLNLPKKDEIVQIVPSSDFLIDAKMGN